MSLNPSPVIIFAYKRKEELQASIEALKECTLFDQTDVYIFSDGSKGDKDRSDVLEVQEYIKGLTGFKNLIYYFSENNKGLATSIINGVTEILKIHPTAIVLEDDLIPAKNFLQYMNQALEHYEDEPKIFSITGYCYSFKTKKDEVNDAFFLPRPCSTGWATWKSRWENLDWDIKDFDEFSNNKKEIKKFKEAGSDIYRMLQRQLSGELDSWAVRWAYNQYKRDGLTVYPVVSKIKNIGFGDQSTNTNIYNKYASKFDEGEKQYFSFPKTIKLDSFYHKQLLHFFSLESRIKNRLLTYLSKVGVINKI